MTLRSKSFLINKGDTLESIAQFLEKEIGLNAFLVKDIEAVALSSTITQITILYNKYSSQILDSVAPREGAIFTTGVASNDFDIRFLFNDPVDFRSIQSGTFTIDGEGLAIDNINLDYSSNNYFLKISASGSNFQTSDFHTYQISNTLKRRDGSVYSYTPVGGYIFHSISNAHIGDYNRSYIDRRRGKVSAAVVRLSKGINPQQGIIEFLSQRRLTDDRLITYTPVSNNTNTVDVYFLYISQLEPQIIGGFPLNNSLLPDVSAPGKVTLVFNTRLDKAKLSSTSGLFTIEEGFNTSTPIPPENINLLSDLQTVELDTSSYFTSQKIYSILARPGILSLDGLLKEKPEQWTIHIASYDPGTGTIFSGDLSGAPSDAKYVVLESSPLLSDEYVLSTSSGIGTATGGGGITIHGLPASTTTYGVSKYDPIYFSVAGGDVSIIESGIDHNSLQNASGYTHEQINNHIVAITGHTGEPSIHFTQAEISITESQISDLQVYALDSKVNTLSGFVTGHINSGEIHYPMSAITINSTQISSDGVLSGYSIVADGSGNSSWVLLSGSASGVPQAVFDSHTGDVSIHYTQASISITESQISDLQAYALSSELNSHTGAYDPHFYYVLRDGSKSFTGEVASTVAASAANSLARWGEVQSFASNAANDALTSANGYTDSSISSLSGYVTGHTGQSSIHYPMTSIDHTSIQNIGTNTHAQIDSHIGSTSNPHSVTAAQVGSPTITQYTSLSGVVTGHTGDSTVHFTQAQISIPIGQLSNVSASTPSQGDTLIYNAGTWTPTAPGSASVSGYVYQSLYFTTNTTLWNQLNQEDFFEVSERNIHMLDLSGFNACRLVARVVTGGASSSKLYAGVATSFSNTSDSYNPIGASPVEVSLAAAGMPDSGWITLSSDASGNSRYITILQNSGNESASPHLGPVYIQFRRQL